MIGSSFADVARLRPNGGVTALRRGYRRRRTTGPIDRLSAGCTTVLAALGCSVALAACGSAAAPSATTNGGCDHAPRLLRFVDCVRSHGVPNVSDPGSGPSSAGAGSGPLISVMGVTFPAGITPQSPAF